MPRQALRVIGLVLVIFACVLTARWYVAWLDQHLIWNPLRYSLPQGLGTYVVAILTAPAIPLAIIVEWMQRGWPEEPSFGFFIWLIGYSLLLIGRSRKPRDTDYLGPDHE